MVQLRVKKPKALIFDVSGTVTKTSFIDYVLLPYMSKNIRSFLQDNWDSPMLKLDIENIRQDLKTNPVEGVNVPQEGKAEIIDAVCKWVDKVPAASTDNNALALLRFHMWFDGYKRNVIETPVYSDVAIQMAKWRGELDIKLFVCSNGWSEATKRFLSKTNQGDLNLLIDRHFDTSMGKLTEASTFKKLLEEIQHPAAEVAFFTKNPLEGKAASQAGLTVVLVLTHRRNIDQLDEECRKMPRVRSFNEIEFEEN